MPLEQFFELYSIYSGRTILRPYQLPAPAGLTLKAQSDLTRVEVVQAMDGVLALNSITMIPIGEKFVKAVPSTQADKEGAPLSSSKSKDLPLAEQFVTSVVKLNHTKPTEMAQTLASFAKTPTAITPIDSNQTIVLRDYASNVKRMLELIEQIDVTQETDYKLEVIPIKYGKVDDIWATMSALIGGGGAGGATAGATAGGAGARSTGAGGRFGGGGGGSRYGGFGGGGGGYGGGGYGGGGYGGSSYGGYGGGSSYGGYGGSRGGSYGGGYGSYSPQEVKDHANRDEVSPMQVTAPGAPAQDKAASTAASMRL